MVSWCFRMFHGFTSFSFLFHIEDFNFGGRFFLPHWHSKPGASWCLFSAKVWQYTERSPEVWWRRGFRWLRSGSDMTGMAGMAQVTRESLLQAIRKDDVASWAPESISPPYFSHLSHLSHLTFPYFSLSHPSPGFNRAEELPALPLQQAQQHLRRSFRHKVAPEPMPRDAWDARTRQVGGQVGGCYICYVFVKCCKSKCLTVSFWWSC